MTTIIITPSGREIRINGNRVCRSSSPEKCREWPSEFVDHLIRYARRHGWTVKMPTFIERERKLRAEFEEKQKSETI